MLSMTVKRGNVVSSKINYEQEKDERGDGHLNYFCLSNVLEV